jgi:hypothetical protein
MTERIIRVNDTNIANYDDERRKNGDRRNFTYTIHIPERRHGYDRREGEDRRKEARLAEDT